MTRLFRSKSCSLYRVNSPAMLNLSPSPPRKEMVLPEEETDDGEEEEEEEGGEIQGYFGDNDSTDADNAFTTPFMTPESRQPEGDTRAPRRNQNQHPVLGAVAAALRKSLVTCSVSRDDVVANMDISCPTDVCHVSHVTFNRFNGSFHGLPVELLPDVPRRVPSASFFMDPERLLNFDRIRCFFDNS